MNSPVLESLFSQAVDIVFEDCSRVPCEADSEFQKDSIRWRQSGRRQIQARQIGLEFGMIRQFTKRRSVMRHSVVTLVCRRNNHSNHLSLHPSQRGLAEHSGLVEFEMSAKNRGVDTMNAQDIVRIQIPVEI
jgi:hypothetical protein